MFPKLSAAALLLASTLLAFPGVPRFSHSGPAIQKTRTCVDLSGTWKGNCSSHQIPEVSMTIDQQGCESISIYEVGSFYETHRINVVESHGFSAGTGIPFSGMSSVVWDKAGKMLSLTRVSLAVFDYKGLTFKENVRMSLSGNKLIYEIEYEGGGQKLQAQCDCFKK